MVHQRKTHMARWELALLLGLGVSLLAGTWLSGQSKDLSQQIIRLHVIGASNSEEDQAVKLRVRDAVLSQAQPWLEGVTDVGEAAEIIAAHLPELAKAGAETAGTSATAALEENAWFPTKEYTDFALPAGEYTALKITIGAGQGRNWWCVVFPPLCTNSVVETASQWPESITEEQVSLITGADEGYVVKFKAIELWSELTAGLS